jgi:hypothetical protein
MIEQQPERGYRSIVVPTDEVDFNPWNPNKQSDDVFRKVKASLVAYGMVELPQVRRVGGRYQVVNGEHRVRAAIELGWVEIPVFDLGVVSDQVAKKLTIITNELRGQPEPVAMSRLIRDLSLQEDLGTLAEELPMSQSELESLSRLTETFDWGAVEAALPTGSEDVLKPPKNLGGERKVQIATYKGSIPVDLANKLLAEYNRSASAIGSLSIESVMADWLDRLTATIEYTDSRATARAATQQQSSRPRRTKKDAAS